MKFTTIKGKLAVLAMLVMTPYYAAQAVTITFEEYGVASGGSTHTNPDNGFATTAQGYDLTPGKWYDYIAPPEGSPPLPGDPLNDMHMVNNFTGTTEHTGGYYPNNGSTILAAHSDVWMEREDGGLFSLYGLDFGGYIDSSLAVKEDVFTVCGYRPDGLGGLSETCGNFGDMTRTAGFEPISIGEEGWHGLAAVMFVHWGDNTDQGSFALDNIQVSAVPVPPALLMFIPGLLGLGIFARRGKASS
jgi:hypothetical protein